MLRILKGLGAAAILSVTVAMACAAADAASPVASPVPRGGEAANHYVSAVASAKAGDRRGAADALVRAIEAGYTNYFSLMYDPDLASARGGGEWARVVEAFERRHPWAGAFRVLANLEIPSWSRYARASAALDAGARPPSEFASTFLQYYATNATFVGEYAEANHYYGRGVGRASPLDAGYRFAHPAEAAILEDAKATRAVFLNESHAQSVTRAVNIGLVRRLRAAGYTHLGLEALAGRSASGQCATLELEDRELPRRGHAVRASGYYLQDPVFAELVRVALEEGLVPVAYDDMSGNPGAEERERRQAHNLACVVQSDPEARLIVIGGFAHISEAEDDSRIPGGLMGYRFKRLTGIDPVTVDTTSLLALNQTELEFARPVPGPRGGRYPALLRNAAGEAFRVPGYDHVVLAPVAASRWEDGDWLTLGGLRQPVEAGVSCPESEPRCLIEAKRSGSSADAVASDRCAPRPPETSCRLYLSPGAYTISVWDGGNHRLAERSVEVAR